MFDYHCLHREVKESELFELFERVEYPGFYWEVYKKKNKDCILYLITFTYWVAGLALQIKIVRNGESWQRSDYPDCVEYYAVNKEGRISSKKIYRTELASNTIRRAWKSYREREKHREIREQFTEWAFRPWNAGGQFIINKLKRIKT